MQSEWFLSLKVGDHVDLFETRWNHQKWYIGTIKEINKAPDPSSNQITTFEILFHYEGWSSTTDEWITFVMDKHSQIYVSDIDHEYCRIKPLHSITPYHNKYLIDDHHQCIKKGMKENNDSNYCVCTICQRRCCNQCFIVSTYPSKKLQYQCSTCFTTTWYQRLFSVIKLLYRSLFHDTQIEINLLKIITNFAMDNIQCNNQMYHCSASINTRMDETLLSNFGVDVNHVISKEEFIIVCSSCCYKKQNNLYWNKSTCDVFHDEIEYCDHCKNEFCIKCFNFSDIGLKSTSIKKYCYLCINFWDTYLIKDNTKSCGVCGETLYHKTKCEQDDCRNNLCKEYIGNKCMKCGYKICNKCESKCGHSGCTAIHCISCIRYDSCYGCKGDIYVCYKHDDRKEINLCNNCVTEKCMKSCNQCQQILYHKQRDECDKCDGIICIDCKEYYGWKCGVCFGKSINTKSKLTNNNNRFLFATINYEIKNEYEDELVEEFIKFDFYHKRRQSKNKQKNKIIKQYKYYGRKRDKIINIKRKRKYNRRYGLSLKD